MIHNLKTNGASAPSIAEQRQAAYTAPSVAGKPVGTPKLQPWRAWLLAAACGLLVGMAGTLYAVDQWAPLPGAARVSNAEIVIANDDSRWFLIGGWAMRLPAPKAPASP